MCDPEMPRLGESSTDAQKPQEGRKDLLMTAHLKNRASIPPFQTRLHTRHSSQQKPPTMNTTILCTILFQTDLFPLSLFPHETKTVLSSSKRFTQILSRTKVMSLKDTKSENKLKLLPSILVQNFLQFVLIIKYLFC